MNYDIIYYYIFLFICVLYSILRKKFLNKIHKFVLTPIIKLLKKKLYYNIILKFHKLCLNKF